MVGSDSRVSQAALSKLQNTVPHPCEPQALSRRATCNVLVTTCPPAKARGFESFAVPTALPLAGGTVAHPSGCRPGSLLPFAFGCHPKRGKTPNRGRRKEQSRILPPLPHTGAELSMEVPRAFANPASQELSFCCPSKAPESLRRQPAPPRTGCTELPAACLALGVNLLLEARPDAVLQREEVSPLGSSTGW